MNESNIFGLSIRGIIAFIIVISICSACLINPNDTKVGILKDLAIMILSFYFGQKSTQTINGGSNVPSNSEVLPKSIQESGAQKL